MFRALLVIAVIASSCGSRTTPVGSPAPTVTASSTLVAASPSGTTASPKTPAAVPLGFTLPPECRVVDSTNLGQSDEWLIDCGAARNRAARDTVSAPLTQQGWTSCGSGLASASWSKGPTMVVISEPADPAIGFRIAQRPKTSPCS